jgi:hypothetical protein
MLKSAVPKCRAVSKNAKTANQPRGPCGKMLFNLMFPKLAWDLATMLLGSLLRCFMLGKIQI